MGTCWCDQLSKDEYLRTVIGENTYIHTERSESTYNSTAPPNSKMQTPCHKEEECTLQKLMDNLNYLASLSNDTEVLTHDNLKLAVTESIHLSSSLNKLRKKAKRISLDLELDSQLCLPNGDTPSDSGSVAIGTCSDDLSWSSELGRNCCSVAEKKLQIMNLSGSCIVEVSEEASMILFSS
jgi:hypothetical protein